MTCIIGLVDDGRVFIGGDSAGVADYALTVQADEKVFKRGPFVFGFTDSFRMGQLLRYALPIDKEKMPRADDVEGLSGWMRTDFIDSVRKCLREGGFATLDNGREWGGTFLVGIYGRLFRVGTGFDVLEGADPFEAVGCGFQLAIGSMATSKGRATSRVKKALEVSERFSAGVRGPFVVVSV